MKTISKFSRFLICSILILGYQSKCMAMKTEVGGIIYEFDGYEAWVIGATDYAKEYLRHLNIPNIVHFTYLGNDWSLEVRSIEEYALLGCSFETAFINAAHIKKNACIRADEITFGDNVCRIEEASCTAYHKITFGKNIEYIGKRAFLGSGCGSVDEPLEPAEITIETQCDSIVIDEFAFMNCGFSSITLGKSVRMRDFSFCQCPNLTSVTMKDGIKRISLCAFYGCENLESVVIPNTVTYIDMISFSMTSLRELFIPESVTHIGLGAFSACSNLESIIVAPLNRVYDSRNDCNAIIETSTNTLHTGCNSTVIPNTVTTIGASAFHMSGLESIQIPNSVTTIGAKAFQSCKNLTKVQFGRSVKTIEASAFNACEWLDEVICLNPEPPDCADVSVFAKDLQSEANDEPYYIGLFVPKGSIQRYLSHYVWDHFKYIAEKDFSALYSDVNEDGEVSIADVTYLIDCILNSDHNSLLDVNCDGEVNIADVTKLIDVILKG